METIISSLRKLYIYMTIAILAAVLFISTALSASAQTVTVIILSQIFIVQETAADTFTVYVMAPNGSNPHIFSPKITQCKHFFDPAFFLGICFPFEE